MTENKNKGTILLVDDDKMLLDSIAMLLEYHNYTVVKAENGNSALACINDHKFDLVITDVRMPDMNGLDMLSRMKEIMPDSFIKAIIITGYASDEIPIKALKFEVNDYILKPFNIDDFIASVNKAMLEVASIHQKKVRDYELEEARKKLEEFKSNS
jgi:YesN/AraC family two-component response regulator